MRALAGSRPAAAELTEAAPGEFAPPSVDATSRLERISLLSLRLVDALRPVTVLPALRWDPSVEFAFHASGAKELPRLDDDHWAKLDLGYDPRAKTEELEEIVRDVENTLGTNDGCGRILWSSALQGRDVVRMLQARGTRDFHTLSRSLYGSPKDVVPAYGMTAREMARGAYERLARLSGHPMLGAPKRTIPAARAASILGGRMRAYFRDADVRVVVDGDVLADAATSGDRIKLREQALFSPRAIDVLEVHEGWVHVATSLNGAAQPIAGWLAKGLPRTTATQEGLAVLMEILTGRSYVHRARKLNLRLLAVDMAEDGASFLEVYAWYRSEGYEAPESFAQARRVFRGGVLEGGAPFTKDVCYWSGLTTVATFVLSCFEQQRPEWVRLLFAGKVAVDDVPALAGLIDEGIVVPPRFVPPIIEDPQGLAVLAAVHAMLPMLLA